MRELKVTRMQIAGVESGNPKSFYNEKFFIDLLKRYARLLNFSEAAIAKMVSPPVVEVVEAVKPEESAQEPTVTPVVVPSEPAAPTKEDARPAMPQQVSIQPVVHDADGADDTGAIDQDHTTLSESEIPRTKTVARLVGVLAVMVLVGVGVAVGLQMTESDAPAPVVSVPTTTAPTAAPTDGPNGPAGSAGPAADSAKPESSQAPAANPTTSTPAAAAPAAAPAKPDVVKPAAVKPPETKPAQTPAPEPKKTDDGQASVKSIVDTPMTLTAKQKSWIWVRDASDQVRQFGVAQGQTVKFDQLPIFIVVHDPSVFEVAIGNKSVSLARNAEDRNVARHTRTDLINFSKQ